MLSGPKFYLYTIDVLLGLMIPGKHKKTSAVAASDVFLATYIPCMADFLRFALNSFQ